MKDITIVTSLQDIRRHNMDGRKWEEYLEWFAVTLQIKSPMVIFVDKDMVDFVKQHRGYQKTKIITQKLEEIPFYKYKERMDSIIETDEYKSKAGCPDRIECNYSIYSIVQFSKFWWVKEAIRHDYFDSDFYFWMDAGLSRFFYDMDITKDYPGQEARKQIELIKDKVLIQVSMFPYNDLYISQDLGEEYLWDPRSYVMGGMFGVGKEKIDELCSLIENTFEKMLDDGNVNNEQIVLGYLYKKYPDLFIEFINDLRIHRGYELIVELSN